MVYRDKFILFLVGFALIGFLFFELLPVFLAKFILCFV